MIRAYKTEINPTEEQKKKIKQTLGTCRYVYNFYVSYNDELHKQHKKIKTAKEFSVWMNNEYLPLNPDKLWIKDVSSKSVKQSLENAYTAYRKFFKSECGYPKLKKKNDNNVKMYFVKNSKTECLCERHRIKVPTLGWVRLKEKGYIPFWKNCPEIISGYISTRNGRYYISVNVDIPPRIIASARSGIGIDVGVQNLAILSDGTIYQNINKTARVKKLEKQLRRAQRSLSHKIEIQKKGEYTQYNINKQKLKVNKLHQRLLNIRTDYINKVISEIAKTKPSYITIETLNIKKMMKNQYLSKCIANQSLYKFGTQLRHKCQWNGIELRTVDMFYPSSKICHNCGCVKKDLKLSDRTYKCGCGYIKDRDLNAALNLRDAKIYSIA